MIKQNSYKKDRTMQTIGYYNGVIAPLEELMIPANDRSNYYADGVYDAAYGRNYKIFALDEHIDRSRRTSLPHCCSRLSTSSIRTNFASIGT